MSDDKRQTADFKSVKERLAEIADAVEDENLTLDDALDLYEEAVALGLQASDLLEVGISPAEEAEAAGADGTDAENAGNADADSAPGESAADGQA